MELPNAESLGSEILARAEQLAAISEDAGQLTRSYLTAEHRQANDLVGQWMAAAGMTVTVDAVGNVVGRIPGENPAAPALMTGSHLDSVRNGGKYDGMLGVLCGLACAEQLQRGGHRLPYPFEVVGFANEEGTRFGATLTGSRGIAGSLDAAALESRDAVGTTLAQGLRDFGLDPAAVGRAARKPDEIAAFVEVHIEQGPVLEAEGLALGTVTAISGATRLRIEIEGAAGHAGTVPMAGRRDALTAAAEAILLVEGRCATAPGLVGTVGRIEARPGAVNVIPGAVAFTLDIRAEDDAVRQAAVTEVLAGIEAIVRRRGLAWRRTTLHEAASCPCDPRLIARIEAAIAAEGLPGRRLPSGAGHDAMAIAAIAPVGMIFVRCEGGISHNPAEAITAADAGLSARALYRFLQAFDPAEFATTP